MWVKKIKDVGSLSFSRGDHLFWWAIKIAPIKLGIDSHLIFIKLFESEIKHSFSDSYLNLLFFF